MCTRSKNASNEKSMRNQAHTPPNSICDIGTQYQHFINVSILAISIHRIKVNGPHWSTSELVQLHGLGQSAQMLRVLGQ